MAAVSRAQRTNRAKKLFLRELARTGNVSESCRLAAISRVAVYEHYGKDEKFAAAWDEALDVAVDGLEFEARRRAVEGVERSVYFQGKPVGKELHYSDTLLIRLLEAHHPAYRKKVEHKISGDPEGAPVHVKQSAELGELGEALKIVQELIGE